MNRVTASISQTCVRNFSITQIRSSDANALRLQKLKKKVQALQLAEAQGIPMFLRGGTKDKILYYTAAFLSFFSAGLGLHSTYKYATKK